MRWCSFLRAAFCLALLAGCGGGAASPGATVGKPVATAGAAVVAPTAAGAPAAQPGSAGQRADTRQPLTAKEAYPVAEAKAKSVEPGYQLYDVGGCYGPAASATYQKESTLVEGRCLSWLFTYLRPMRPGDTKGYYELRLWVDANGVLSSQEKLYDQQAVKKPKGSTADWKVDSTEAIQIVENDRGRAWRQQNPEWDTARPESDHNAVIIAKLEFFPYWDVALAKGKEVPGEKSVVWTVKYPPVDRWVYVIDANTGKVLLKTEK